MVDAFFAALPDKWVCLLEQRMCLPHIAGVAQVCVELFCDLFMLHTFSSQSQSAPKKVKIPSTQQLGTDFLLTVVTATEKVSVLVMLFISKLYGLQNYFFSH